MLLPFGARYPAVRRGKSVPATDMPKSVKTRCTISALACSGELLAHESLNDQNGETRMTNDEEVVGSLALAATLFFS